MAAELSSRTGDILEIGALYSVRVQNIPAFERYISQLAPYYRDYRCRILARFTGQRSGALTLPVHSSVLPPSERRFPLLGLDLLRLLAQNKIAQFHTVLESLVKESGKEKVDISAS